MKKEIKELQIECDNRARNQQELGLKIRTQNAEMQALQSRLEATANQNKAEAESVTSNVERKHLVCVQLFADQ